MIHEATSSAIGQLQVGQKRLDRRDLVALGRSGQLAEQVPLARSNTVTRCGGALLAVRAPRKVFPSITITWRATATRCAGPHEGPGHLVQDGRVRTGQNHAERRGIRCHALRIRD